MLSEKRPTRSTQALLLLLGAWTLFIPPLFAGLLYAMFWREGSTAAAVSYLVLGYGAVLVALGGNALLGLITFVSAFSGRAKNPTMFWAGALGAPVAFCAELGFAWWLLGRGLLL